VWERQGLHSSGRGKGPPCLLHLGLHAKGGARCPSCAPGLHASRCAEWEGGGDASGLRCHARVCASPQLGVWRKGAGGANPSHSRVCPLFSGQSLPLHAPLSAWARPCPLLCMDGESTCWAPCPVHVRLSRPCTRGGQGHAWAERGACGGRDHPEKRGMRHPPFACNSPALCPTTVHAPPSRIILICTQANREGGVSRTHSFIRFSELKSLSLSYDKMVSHMMPHVH
jgi:hypothetical protein